MSELMSQFHFLRPEFLLLIPCVLILALLVSQIGTSTSWAQYISASKLKMLVQGESTRGWKTPLLFSLAGLICCLAIAGPTWEKRPVPTIENASALVVLLDLSPSMLAEDIQPNRLVRARLKITDLLRQRKDGQTALIAYAGSAHRVSPLTDDSDTIEALLPALTPQMMPQTGSNVEAAVQLGMELLESSGYQNHGHLLVVTDGIEPDAQKAINDMLPAGIHLSILGVGTVEGAPIPLGGGNFYRDSRGEIVLAKLNRNELQILAGRSAGRYIELQPDDSDLAYLLDYIENPSSNPTAEIETTYDSWHDVGYWLIFLLIPLALMAFRREYLLSVALILFVSLPSEKADAGIWDDIWYTKDQQAQRALEEGDAAAAVDLFKAEDWRGYAAYQAEEFETALDELQNSETTSLYNLGTSQARAGMLEEALENLNQFVEANPNHENARFNRDLVEQLLQQQEQQDQQNQQGSDQNQQGENQQSEDQQQADNSAGEQQEQSTSDQQQQSDQQESQQQASQSKDSSDQQEPSATQKSSDEEESQQASENEDEQGEEETEQQSASSEESEQEGKESEQTAALAEPSEEDLSDASEQWLRGIPDDPSGLLRRKFEYESQLYRQQSRFIPQTPGQNDEPRY